MEFDIKISGTVNGLLKILQGTDTNKEIVSETINLTTTSSTIHIKFNHVNISNSGVYIWIDPGTYSGDITVHSVENIHLTYNGETTINLDSDVKPNYTNGNLSSFKFNDSDALTIGEGGGLIAQKNLNSREFHLRVYPDENLDPTKRYKLRMIVRGDRVGQIYVNLNNENAQQININSEWQEISTSEINYNAGQGWTGTNDWFGIWSGHDYFGKLDIRKIEIIEISEDGYTMIGEAEEVYTLFKNQDFNDMSEIPTSMLLDDYIPTLENGTIVMSDNLRWHQFTLCNNLNIVKGKDYRVELELKGDKAGTASLALGNGDTWDDFNRGDRNLSYTTEWSKQTVTFNSTNSIGNPDYCELRFQVGTSDVNLQFRSIRIMEIPDDGGVDEPQPYEVSDGWPFPDNYLKSPEVSEDGIATFIEKQDYALFLNLPYEKGRTYAIKAKMKCTGGENGKILDLTKVNCILGDWDNPTVFGYFDQNLISGEDWKDVSIVLNTFATSGIRKQLRFNTWSGAFEGMTLQMKDISLVSNTIDKNNEYYVFSQIDDNEIAESGFNNNNTSVEVVEGEQVLNVPHPIRGFKGLTDLTLEPRTNYRVKVRLKSTSNGTFTIKLGNDKNVQSISQNIKASDEWTEIETDFYNVEADKDGYCLLVRENDLEGLTIDNVEIGVVTPALNENTTVGFDYFDVTLPDPLSAGDVYYLNLSRIGDSNLHPSGTSPLRFRVVAMDVPGKGQLDLGEFGIGAYKDVSSHKNNEKSFDTNVVTNQFVRVPIQSNAIGAKSLRFYCTLNSDDKIVVCKEDNQDLIAVPAMRITELGLYKLTDWKNTDAESDATWVMPVISRFQVEANAKAGNYPGPDIRTAIKGNNNNGYETNRYANPGATLFDGDDTSFWQTSATENNIGDKRCIDLLLPPLNSSSANKQTIKGAIEYYKNKNEVDLLKNGNLNLVVRFSRPQNAAINFPIEIRYCGSTETDVDKFTETNWKTMVLPLVDPEGDIHFSLDVDPSWRRVRIECIVGSSQNETPQGHDFGLSEIRAYIEMPKIDLEKFDYNILYNNRLFDYVKDDRGSEAIKNLKLSGFSWNHSHGIVDDINDPTVDGKKWADDWSDALINNLNDFKIGNSAIPLAKYDYINGTNHDDSDGLNETQSSKVSGDRQRTYVVTHDIYTLPGKRVDLYPYSDIHSTNYYEDQFVRWYDYQTDGTPSNLYFFTDPKSVIRTNEHGFYGSKILLDGINRGPGTVGSVYFDNNATIKDQWIAADFAIHILNPGYTDEGSLSNFQKRFGFGVSDNKIVNQSKSIEEPIITFRHLFHIMDGKKFADEFSADYAANVAYNRKNRKYISARANADFTIRLENAMPLGKDYSEFDGDNSTKSSYFYKRGKEEYVRVCSYDIVAYKADDNGFTSMMQNIKTSNYKDNGVAGMFVPYDRSFYTNAGAIISSTLEDTDGGVNWVPNNRGFARAIFCDKKDAEEGKYLVRLYGLDDQGKIITIFESGDKPLVVAEYEVTFLPEEMASFVPEHRLKNLKPTDVLYTHTEDYLEATYNPSDKARKAVNFDKFSRYNLEKGIENGTLKITTDDISKILYSVSKDNLSTTEGEYTGAVGQEYSTKPIGVTQSGNYLKMPLKWTESNYGFGFDQTGDYNIYRLADHSSATVYNSAANRRKATDNPEDKTLATAAHQGGVYDRLFYNTNGEQKGMFYYVNAASDPGDIVEIKIDNPCPGATLYVSGWVNEFNDHQTETANIIVNYYANITEDLNADGTAKKNGKVTRRVQMKGFETGYVPNQSKNMEAIYPEGKQGDWMHFYFSFVPNVQRVKETLTPGEEAIVDYSLILENNSISSWGADYAIDDIRAYVAPARVEAYQNKPICDSRKDENGKRENLQIEVRLPFDALMESLGLSESETEATDVSKRYESLQYAILDKELYEKKLKAIKGDNSNYEFSYDDYYEAFQASVIKYPHIHLDTEAAKVSGNKDKEIPWGTIYFNNHYDGNLEWDQANYDGDNSASGGVPVNRAMKHTVDDERNISFITTPPMNPEKRDYIIVIGNFGESGIFDDYNVTDKTNNVTAYGTSTGINYDKLLAQAFSMGSNCCRMAEFTLNKAAQKVVDGILYGDDDQITCCENQRPVVQLNLYRNDKTTGNIYDKDDLANDKLWENPYLDWYYGTYEEFMKAEMADKTSLWQVLAAFRDDYPTSTTWDVPAFGDQDKDGNQIPTGRTDESGNPINPTKYTTTMKGYLKELFEDGKLQLYQASFVFPNLVIGNDENGKKKKSEEFHVTAVPIDSKLTTAEYIVCTEPTEIKITVTNTSPQMNNGFASGITYPDGMDIVPLRLGLKHTDKSSAAAGNWTAPADTEAQDQITLDLSKYEGKETLVMPLRGLDFATEGVTKFKRVAGDPYCYLAETNDPAYRKLGQVVYKSPKTSQSTNGSGNGEVATQAEPDASLKYDSDFGLVPRGKIDLIAGASETFSNVTITFNSSDMQFHEGYYYTFKFPYEEDYSNATMPDHLDPESMPCHGETYFTIKVVPEYQQWTGAASLNWNNDDNWTRVSGETLLASSDTPSGIKDGLSTGATSDDRFTVNANNPNTFSYAPLDFTKVIIPAGTTYPQLAAIAHDRESESGSLSLNNGHGNAIGYVWTGDDPKAADASGSQRTDVASDKAAASSYHPTENVQYDMAAVTYDADGNVYCRPWYANACEQIHFNSNAEILNQQNLDYEKAWVDMEMKPHRWYTVASPLQGIVAGDMYLPKTDARQATELFTDISFSSDNNDRFAPAVYQRGWDKGTEKVYNIEGNSTGCPKEETVALASTWSHVYNDVAEKFEPGAGYSVKTDVTRLGDFPDGGLVKFRFPKADTSFDYYEDKNSGSHKTENGITRGDNIHKLYSLANNGDVTLTKQTEGNLFLVGNPFMAHLDMAKFLKANEGVIAQKFWILTETDQITGVMDHTTEGSILVNDVMTSGDLSSASTVETSGLIAPMQGFFVQSTSKGKELTITFTSDMMAVKAYNAASDGLLLKAPANPHNAQRSASLPTDIIRVSTEESAAIIRLTPSAEKGYAASEDVEMIDDSNQRGIRRVYTIAGNMASAINQTPDADGVEVGLMAPADSVTNVVFNGVALEEYFLLDMETGEMTQLYDGFSTEMKGSVSGRYFLTRGLDTSDIEDGSISIEPMRGEVMVKAPLSCGALTVRVFDTLGREVAKAEGSEQQVSIPLEPGIYVVDVRGEERGRRSAKISLR